MTDATNALRLRTLLWAAGSLACLAAAAVSSGAGWVAVLVCSVPVLFLLRDPLPTRVLVTAALVPAALPSPVVWAVVLAGAVVVALPGRRGPSVLADLPKLRHHLERARRREEALHLLLLRGSSQPPPRAVELIQAFRLTDSVALTLDGDRYELVALLDDHNLQREGVERRLLDVLPVGTRLAWAHFPEDGYSIETLMAEAGAALEATGSRQLPLLPGLREDLSTRPLEAASES